MADAATLKIGSETYSSAIADAHEYMRWLVHSFEPWLAPPILEIGIGHGRYCELFRRYGDYLGVDHDPECVARARLQFPGLRFETLDVLDRAAVSALPSMGSIVSMNVFEHIDDDRLAIANLVGALRSGGHLCILVPALMGLYNDLDRLAGHVRRYTLADFRTISTGLPVRIKVLRYFNPLGGVGWWANKFRHTRSLDDEGVNAQIRAFDRFGVPVSRTLDPLFRRFFGQSVICIMERP